jgi:chromosome segregation protein
MRALEQALAEQEGLPPAARALAEDGARLALAALDVPAGGERAVAAALRSRASAVLADDPAVGLALLQRARAAGLGSLTVLAGRSPRELVAEYPVVPLDALLDVTTPSVTAGGFGYDPARGELWFVGETAEAVLLELQGRRTALAAEVADLDRDVEAATRIAEETAARARAAEAALGRAPRLRAASIDATTLSRLVDVAETLRVGIGAVQRAANRFEAPLRARVDAGATRAGELGEELRTLGAAEVNLRRELEEASAADTAAEVEIARIDAEVAEATRRLESAGGTEPADGDDRDELSARVERLETRRATLGQVNPLAREEYEAEKERLDDLKMQRADLEQSLEELEKLRAELSATVERRFADTFAAVADHFEEVASTLFPGGEGRLRLIDSEEDGAEPGVEVELRPAGKRITRLSLLSGGEKALGAISFLFALFLARPCAFYLLDEVEAALDDTNIARFVELLRRYSDRAQFVVVTHQKRTMEAADILYGVTMGPDGVSQVVSRRLPQHQRQAEHAAA